MADIFDQENAIIIAAADKFVALGQEAAERVVSNGKEAKKQDKEAEDILRYLTAYRQKDNLTSKQLEAILYVLKDLSDESDFPTVDPIVGASVIYNFGHGGGSGSVTSAELSAEVVTLLNAINFVSNSLSVEIVARGVADNLLSNAISVVSQAVSMETSNRISADNALSAHIDTESQQLSQHSQQLSVLSQAISVVSNAVSVETSNRISADNVVSAQAASVASQLLSLHNVLSNRVSANSAVGSGSVTSNKISNVVSNQNSVNNTLSQQISVLSQSLSVHSQGMSVLSQGLSVVSLAGANTSNTVSILSNTVSALSDLAITEVSNRVSAVNAVSNALSNETSNRISGDTGLSNRISNLTSVVAGIGGSGSVTSNKISNVTSAHNVLSNQVSAISGILSDHASAINVVSNATSAVSNALSAAKLMIWEDVASANYTFSAGDNNKIKRFTNTASVVGIVPTGLPSGWQVVCYRAISAGNVTISSLGTLEGVGFTLNTEKTGLEIAHRGGDVHVILGAVGLSTDVSQIISAETANRISADNALSNTISNNASVVSQGLSLASQGLSVISNALSNEISNRGSAVNVVSNALSNETSNRISAANVMSQGISVLSQQVSVLSQQVSVLSQAHSALSNRVSQNSGVGGGSGSVTSTKVSNIQSNLLSAISVVSQALSAAKLIVWEDVASAAYTFSAGDNGKAKRFTNAGAIVAIVPTGLVSGWNAVAYRAIAAGLITISSLGTLEGIGFTVDTEQAAVEVIHRGGDVHVVLGAAGSGGAGSVTSTELSNGLSIVSAQAASAISQLNSVVSQGLSLHSQQISVLSQQISALSQQASVTSQNLSSITNIVLGNYSANDAALSVRIDTQSQSISVLSQQVSTLSQNASAISNTLSNEISARIAADNFLSDKISVLNDAHSVLSNRVSTNSGTGGGSGSVTSTKVSNVQSNLQSAINVVSNTASNNASIFNQGLSVMSQAISVLSQGVSVVSNALSNEISNRISVRDALSNNVSQTNSVVSQLNSVVSQGLSLASQNRSVISNALSVETSNRTSADNALSNTISQTNSVVSQGLSLMSQGISVVSNALSKETSNRISADNALSDSLSIHSNIISNLLSLGLGAYAGIDVQSNAISQLNSVHNVLSNRVSANSGTGGAGSVTSTELSNGLSIVSAQAASAISAAKFYVWEDVASATYNFSALDNGKVKRFTNATGANTGIVPTGLPAGWQTLVYRDSGASAITISSLGTLEGNGFTMNFTKTFVQITNRGSDIHVVAGATGASGTVSNEASNRVSADNALSNSISVELSNRVSTDNALSQGISVISQAHSALSQVVSLISQGLSNEISNRTSMNNVVSNAVSNEISNRVSADNALSNFISGNFGNQISILSQSISVLSVNVNTISNATSIVSQAISVLSQQLSVISQAVSVLSQQVSLAGGFQVGLISTGIQGVSGVSTTGMPTISGMSVSVAANGIYQIVGAIMFQMSVSNAYGIGMTFPGMKQAACRFFGTLTVAAALGDGFSTTRVTGGYLNENGSNSIIVSAIVGTAGVTEVVLFDGVFNVSTAGTIQMVARASVTTSPLNILPGSYIRAVRVG